MEVEKNTHGMLKALVNGTIVNVQSNIDRDVRACQMLDTLKFACRTSSCEKRTFLPPRSPSVLDILSFRIPIVKPCVISRRTLLFCRD